MHVGLYMLKRKTLFKICLRLAMFEYENEMSNKYAKS